MFKLLTSSWFKKSDSGELEIAPIASSESWGAANFLATKIPNGKPRLEAISEATTTPPRGIPKTTAFSLLIVSSILDASFRPAS
jgi:hypothetical protein